MSEPSRTDIYRYGDVRVDVQVRPKAWMARVRFWSGRRWPRLEKTWYACTRRWLPWFSLERQAVKAIEYANYRSSAYLPRDEVRKHVRQALQLLK